MLIEIYFEDLNKEKQERLRPFLESAINTDSPIFATEIDDETMLEIADEKGMFNDLICDYCEGTIDIDYRDKIEGNNLSYKCPNCGHQNLLSFDVIEDRLNNN